MSPLRKKQKKHFRKFKAGHVAELMDLIESERSFLYDYLMRMTGQVNRSADTIEEVISSFSSEDLDEVLTVEEFRILLYKTARKFNADIWHADTSRLINESFERKRKDPDFSDDDEEKLAATEIVANILRGLDGFRRECLVLNLKSEFEFEEIAEITSQDLDSVKESFDAGLKQLNIASSQIVSDAERSVKEIPHHPPPIYSIQETMNLSVLMKDIKERPRGLSSPFKITMVTISIFLVIGYYFYPEFFVLPEWIKELLPEIP